MANFSQNDIQLLYIGAAATKTTTTIEAMNDGEIGIFTPAGGRVVESGASGTQRNAADIDEFIIVKKTANSGIPLVSGIIKKADIQSASRVVYAAATLQVDTIGYDGSAGSIDVTNSNDYHIRFNIGQGRNSNHGGLDVRHGWYQSDASATQYEIADGLFAACVAEFSKDQDQIIAFEMLSDDAGTAIGGSETLTVTNGSKRVLSSGTSHALVAGDVVRIGGTATTDPCYTVASVSGAEIVLTVPYQGANATTVAAEELTALTGAFGITATAVAPSSRVGKLHNDLAQTWFSTTLENFGTTTFVAEATASYAGTGTEKQIQELEFFCQGNEGDFYRVGEPNLFDRRTEASGNYDLIHLNVVENYQGSMVSGPVKKTHTLALPDTAPNYAIAATANDITDVLEILIYGAAGGELAVT